jgi:hypothetical protein
LPSPSARDAKIECNTVLGVPVRPAFAVDGFTRREETTITGGAIILTPRER